MRKIENCIVENCIPTPSSCVEWNGGDIKYLGICQGDSLNNVVWEIVTKLQELAGIDISTFNLDELLDICNKKAPLEVNIISILQILRDNEICLKDYIDTLNDKINELSKSSNVSVNLKCFADFDNLGNALSVTRETLDQLVIDQLCNHEGRLDTAEGKLINLQNQINNIDQNITVDELSFPTCLDVTIKPTSAHVISTAQEVCDIETSFGSPSQITVALSRTPGDLNPEFGLIPNWILTPATFSDNYNNMLLEVENLRQRVIFMETNCCAVTCDDVKVGFSAVMNEDGTGVILRFTNGAGTSIPLGFTDSGSTVTITDQAGDSVEYLITISNNAEEEVSIAGMDISQPLNVVVTVKMTNGAITCEKCVTNIIKLKGCNFCVLTASGDVTITYKTCING